MKENIALIVHACDRYAFLYEGFNFFFNKYWQRTSKVNLYFATENIDTNFEGFNSIKSGNGEWADRLKFLLENKIKEDYVLYFQEDMWLTAKTDSAFIEKLIEFATANKAMQIKLHSADVYKTEHTDFEINGFNIAEVNKSASDFLMSHQVTLWNKDFLIAQLHKNEHPWRNERKGTKRLKKSNATIYHIDYFSENGSMPINQNSTDIVKSGYKTVSKNSLLNHNTPYFIHEMETDNYSNTAYLNKLKYNFENNITHDGKEKPRKTDIFKLIKTKLKTLFSA